LDPISEPDIEAAWSAEIERRLVEIDAGTVELIPSDYVRAELFGESDPEVQETWTAEVERRQSEIEKVASLCFPAPKLSPN